MKFLTSNSWEYRLLRTIAQGICGVLFANIDVLISSLTIADNIRPIIVALCMAILSPIMAEIGRVQDSKLVPTEDGPSRIRNEDNASE